MAAILLGSLMACGSAQAGTEEETEEELARQMTNPVAAVVSVPFQYNYDDDIGSAKGWRSLLNIQPVLPFVLNADWNIVSRTIVPIVDQHDVAGLSGNQSGLGDIGQSLFFVPRQTPVEGLTWGVGPVFLLPTATDPMLGTKKWGLGPTGVLLMQRGPWTVGALANHVWSVAGSSSRPDVSTTLLQPFVSYVTATRTTFTVSSESTYNWENKEWRVPVNAGVSQLFKAGGQVMQLGLFARYWAESPDVAPQRWGMRVVYTLIFPR